MKTRLHQRFVGLGTTMLICSIITIVAQPTYGQRGKRTYRSAQFEQSMPSVDVPSPAYEGEAFPSVDDVIPPSLDESSTRIVPEMMDPAPIPDPTMPDGQESFQEGITYDQPVAESYPIDQQYSDGLDEGPAPIYSTGTWYRRGRWYSGFEVMFMARSDARNGPIVNNGQQTFVLDALVTQNFQPGTRLTLGKFLGRDAAGRDHLLEGEFTGLFEWSDERTLDSQNPLGVGGISSSNTVNTTPAFGAVDNADSQTFRYDTDYNQFALNYRLSSRPGRDQMAMQPDGRWVRLGSVSQMRTLIAGAKYMSFNDSFLNSAIRQDIADGDVQTTFTDGETGDVTQTGPVLADNAIRGSYDVLTNNDMFGLHIGGEAVEKYDEWSWGLRGTLGGLANFAQRRSSARSTVRNQDTDTEVVQRTNDDGDPLFLDADGNVTTDPTGNTPLEDTTVTTITDYSIASLFSEVNDEQLVFVADAGLFATYQLRPNLQFKASYNMTYISGLALAPENLLYVNDFEDINLHGSTFIHGGSVGFETTW